MAVYSGQLWTPEVGFVGAQKEEMQTGKAKGVIDDTHKPMERKKKSVKEKEKSSASPCLEKLFLHILEQASLDTANGYTRKTKKSGNSLHIRPLSNHLLDSVDLRCGLV